MNAYACSSEGQGQTFRNSASKTPMKALTFALGKPRTHISMNQLHDQHMTAGVTKASHNLMIDLFVDSLQDNGFTDEDIETIVARLQSVTGEIVTKGIEK